MATGCQGPFVNGTGGWCGCNCKCCPPADTVTTVTITYGPPPPPTPTTSVMAATIPVHLNLPGPPQEMPSFDYKPILSKDKRFMLGASADQPCSVPCPTFTVLLTPAQTDGVCGFQVDDETIIAVGNGYMDVTPDLINVPGCGNIEVLINGQVPPTFILDGDEVVVTLFYTDPWNSWCCQCIEISAELALSAYSFRKSLLRYKVEGGKVKIDPETGKPMLILDKQELLRRVIERRQKLRRKKK